MSIVFLLGIAQVLASPTLNRIWDRILGLLYHHWWIPLPLSDWFLLGMYLMFLAPYFIAMIRCSPTYAYGNTSERSDFKDHINLVTVKFTDAPIPLRNVLLIIAGGCVVFFLNSWLGSFDPLNLTFLILVGSTLIASLEEPILKTRRFVRRTVRNFKKMQSSHKLLGDR